MSDNLCTVTKCDRPVHDGWYVCEPCGADLAERLSDIAWILEQIDLVMSQQTRYGQTAGKVAAASDEQPIPYNVKASEQRAYLVNAISSAARLVIDENPKWRADPFWRAIDDSSKTAPRASSCASWLAHRIAGLRLHPLGGVSRDEIMRHWAACEWLIDRPPERRYLGICATDWEDQPCGGRIYQHNGKPEARCDTCGGLREAEALREVLMAEARDRHVTAAEASLLSTYLGLSIGRTAVRKLVNNWIHRKVIETRAHDDQDGESRVLFGDVMDRLARFETERESA
jgi:hypothetical protein